MTTQLDASGGPRRRTGFLQPRTWSSGSLDDRFAALRPYVEGRRVLDLGCATGHHRPDWLHGRLRTVATEVVGVDLDSETVAALREEGWDIVCGNAEDVRLERSFGAVVAGELIEHLSNPGRMLETARVHLEPDGMLVMTTPNAFAVSNFVYRVGGTPRVNPDHTCWFDEATLRQLLERYGYEVTRLEHLEHRTPGNLRSLVARGVRRVLPARLAWNTILVVAEPR